MTTALKNIALILLAALVGYVIWKVYQAVTSVASGVTNGISSVTGDVSSAAGAVTKFAQNPLAAFQGSASSNADTSDAEDWLESQGYSLDDDTPASSGSVFTNLAGTAAALGPLIGLP